MSTDETHVDANSPKSGSIAPAFAVIRFHARSCISGRRHPHAMGPFSDCFSSTRVHSLHVRSCMAFNLKKVLKALLLSSSQPLSIKDIQAAFTRFHEQPAALPVP